MENNQISTMTPAHLYGPPPPHIAFYHGGNCLGETRGHPSNIEAARQKLLRTMELKMFWPELDAKRIRLMSYEVTAKLYCGPVSMQLPEPVELEPEAPQTPLQAAGYVFDRADGDAVAYVLMVVVDPQRKKAIGLLKQKGPSFLFGRVTFPGGQVEAGETLEAAASREMLEETGVIVAQEDWRFLARTADMAVFFTECDRLDNARTMETEPVFILDIESQVALAATSPQIFAPDFLAVMQGVLAL